ncbi:hypothetical protein ONS95_011673 [Cadophora gregata]|uniref:uncharacterized protein n=1 Tax=Cadophora gregata TaxID=51156 RepID=UPI0026DCDA9B|nr:uncharacterized protein ONS95_011673 [Cadophora gregata]KAK0120267.1 hypothetical protein ONS95_011673 [Cadophora gregata]KAK0121301.1 hypothetical protein ONS96_011475 [Cadophora gregata f. sp. sojae]
MDELALRPKTMYSDWYSGTNIASKLSTAIISEAYEEARNIFQTELSTSEKEKVWANEKSSIDAVRDEVSRASERYHSSRSPTKAREWLLKFSERVAHYGAIMDVLVQHHPEYTSLAWGTMKFLFTAVINHEELTKQLAKALCKIADVLPRTDFTLILYPTAVMQEAVARLYAYVMKFLRTAIVWYKKGKVYHAIGSVINPWALSFKENVQEIDEQSRMIDRLASTASKAELRDMHHEIAEQRTQLAELIAMLKQQSPQIEQLVSVAIATRNIQEEIKLDLNSHKGMLQQIQLTQILDLKWSQDLPSSGESLGYCLSIQKRKRTRTKLSHTQVTMMQTWAAARKSSVMIIQSRSASTTKDLLIDLVSLIRTTSHPIIWALRFPNYSSRQLTRRDILRVLVSQALQINPSATSSSNPVTAVHLMEAVDEDDWFRLLG